MNRYAIITSFLGEVKNRYMTYHPARSLRQVLDCAASVEECTGVELCYPADFDSEEDLIPVLADRGLGVSAVNFRSRRTGRWLRGSFTSADRVERCEVVDDLRRAMDAAAVVGATRVSTCPLNDGTDGPFGIDYPTAFDFAMETLGEAAAHNRDIRICIEYKLSDPMSRCFFGTAGEVAAFCGLLDAPNVGATLDFGHSILGREVPSQAAALLARAGRLFYVHLNDNDGYWDWDQIPGTTHLWLTLEFLYTLRKLGYADDWFAFDVFAKEYDLTSFLGTALRAARRFEAIAEKMDANAVEQLTQARHTGKAMEFMLSLLKE